MNLVVKQSVKSWCWRTDWNHKERREVLQSRELGVAWWLAGPLPGPSVAAPSRASNLDDAAWRAPYRIVSVFIARISHDPNLRSMFLLCAANWKRTNIPFPWGKTVKITICYSLISFKSFYFLWLKTNQSL